MRFLLTQPTSWDAAVIGCGACATGPELLLDRIPACRQRNVHRTGPTFQAHEFILAELRHPGNEVVVNAGFVKLQYSMVWDHKATTGPTEIVQATEHAACRAFEP